ncbi:MAG: hypothetical protein ACI4K7_01115 [Oscillospiraceae bacterium]
MNNNLVAENHYKSKTNDEKSTAVTKAVEKMINRALLQAIAVKK